MGLLNIKVYPSEDLKTVRIRTGLGINSSEMTTGSEQDYCGKVLFAPLKGTIPTKLSIDLLLDLRYILFLQYFIYRTNHSNHG